MSEEVVLVHIWYVPFFQGDPYHITSLHNPGDSPSATDLILLSLLNSPILLRSSLVLNTLDVSWINPPENFQAFVSGN